MIMLECALEECTLPFRCKLEPAPTSAALSPSSFSQSGPSYIEAFLTVLKNVTKDETVQYVLAMVEETLAGGWPGGAFTACI